VNTAITAGGGSQQAAMAGLKARNYGRVRF
jgi:hypothetical protein